MIPSVDAYLDRPYRQGQYTCLEYASEVWMALGGRELAHDWATLRHSFARVQRPQEPCIALFRSGSRTHVGVYLRGKVLHLTERDGAQHVPLHVVATWFRTVRFYVEHPSPD